MKGIILAGGFGTRLYPTTLVTSKQLLPIYDKPMLYYPLSILMMSDIKDILIISTKDDLIRMENLLGDGKRFGINLQYKIQEYPYGIAQAFLIGEDFLQNDACALILGDNLFHGAGLIKHLKEAVKRCENNQATIFAYYVKDPSRFGVVQFDEKNNVLNIEEKPLEPKSNYC